jgi:integrase
VEEIIAVMRTAGDSVHGARARALVVILWRAGLRINEALMLAETDLEPRRGSVLVRCGKGGKRREVGMDDWGWEHLEPWRHHRLEMPVGPFFCVIDGVTRGRGWSHTGAVPSSVGSRRWRGCGGGLRRSSSGMRVRSRWPAKGCRCRSSSGSSGMRISG